MFFGYTGVPLKLKFSGFLGFHLYLKNYMSYVIWVHIWAMKKSKNCLLLFIKPNIIFIESYLSYFFYFNRTNKRLWNIWWWYFITIKRFNINKQKIKFLHLSELVRCYFGLIFNQRVEVIYVDYLKNSKVLNMLVFLESNYWLLILRWPSGFRRLHENLKFVCLPP